MKYKNVEIEWLHHDCFRFTDGEMVIYTDPYKVRDSYNDADIILITHEHYDHADINSINKLINPETRIVAQVDCKTVLDPLKNQKLFVTPGQTLLVSNIKIETVPSYNTNKFREGKQVFHPKEKGNVGYVFTLSGVRIYIAGDTDYIPEMKGIKADIALLPVSGTYVMTPEEAAQAALAIKPEIAIPMHYGSGIGTEENAEQFKKLLEGKVKVEILKSIES